MFSPRVTVQDWYRGAPENLHLGKVRLPGSSRELSVSLGNVERDQRYDYFFLVRVPSIVERGASLIGAAEISFALPGEGTSRTDAQQWTLRIIGTDRRPVVNSEIERDFLHTEIKRLEKERDEALARQDRAEVLRIFEEISGRYTKLGNKLANDELLTVKEHYMQTGNISNEESNMLGKSSTTPHDSGALPNRLPDSVKESIFGRAPSPSK